MDIRLVRTRVFPFPAIRSKRKWFVLPSASFMASLSNYRHWPCPSTLNEGLWLCMLGRALYIAVPSPGLLHWKDLGQQDQERLFISFQTLLVYSCTILAPCSNPSLCRRDPWAPFAPLALPNTSARQDKLRECCTFWEVHALAGFVFKWALSKGQHHEQPSLGHTVPGPDFSPAFCSVAKQRWFAQVFSFGGRYSKSFCSPHSHWSLDLIPLVSE